MQRRILDYARKNGTEITLAVNSDASSVAPFLIDFPAELENAFSDASVMASLETLPRPSSAEIRPGSAPGYCWPSASIFRTA